MSMDRQLSVVESLKKYSTRSRLCKHALELAYLQSDEATSLMEEVAQWYEVGGPCAEGSPKYIAGTKLWDRINQLMKEDTTMTEQGTKYEQVAKVSGIVTRKTARGTKVAAKATGKGLARFARGLAKAGKAFKEGVREG